MSFPRYPKYKDSGVEWLGQVPEHWATVPCRAIVREQTAKNDGASCEDYLSVMANVGVIPYEEKGDVGNKKPEDLSKCKLVSKGDFVINSMNYGIGSYGISAYDGVCSPVYIVMTPRLDVVESRFAFRIFENRAFQTYAQSFGNGILAHRCAINWDILKPIGMPVPPVSEQQGILAFLDRETFKIDALIAEQQRLIELLQEKRQAVISHAVTKGLNPDAPMKDSGIEWLGEVPEHWEVGPLKRFGTSLDGRRIPLSTEERSYRQGDYPYYGASGVIDSVDNYLFDEDLVLVSEDGANLLNRSSPIAFVATGRYWVNNHAHIFRPIDGNLHYWAERIEAVDLTPFVSGSAQPKFTAEALLNLRIAVPPSESERGEIEDRFIGETRVIAKLIAQAEQAVILLQERRAALISAAVTGQIDVRGFSSGGSEAA
jgi:type I restriction enzyme S subunit